MLLLGVFQGVRDYSLNEIPLRQSMFRIISECFERHGGLKIETPVLMRQVCLFTNVI